MDKLILKMLEVKPAVLVRIKVLNGKSVDFTELEFTIIKHFPYSLGIGDKLIGYQDLVIVLTKAFKPYLPEIDENIIYETILSIINERDRELDNFGLKLTVEKKPKFTPEWRDMVLDVTS